MKLSIIALDYDGTISQCDTLDPAVRAANAEARTRGIVVMLVTGRILDELRRVAGDLHFVDGVVAENGAVVHFPGSGRHAMLQLAEVGVAVEWGSEALRAAADVTLAGTGPAAVAEYVRSLAASGRVPMARPARRRLRLGYTEDGREFSLAVRGRNVLIAGDARSGKSWLAGLLAEQLILHGYALCVLDAEGDYRSLEELPGVTVLGGEDPPPAPRDLLRALRYPDRSVVIDLSHVPHDRKIDYIRAALSALNVLRRRTGLPHRILLDEAHYFLHDAGAEHLLDLETNGYTIVTHCASRLPPELLAATEVMLVTCESSPAEIDALCRRWAACEDEGEIDAERSLHPTRTQEEDRCECA